MPTYKLHWEDGSDAGQARYNDWLRPGDEIHFNGTARLRVLEVIDVEEPNAKIDGLLMVEPSKQHSGGTE
jgi:hypothetical protein